MRHEYAITFNILQKEIIYYMDMFTINCATKLMKIALI
ncbi:hypothetical protein FM120_10750 [Sphingobacterium faecium PCAi_F2.5]|nr:hypothetical protein FM120_10750 [Sphingobacterium faecium PCAi_F2.5]